MTGRVSTNLVRRDLSAVRAKKSPAWLLHSTVKSTCPAPAEAMRARPSGLVATPGRAICRHACAAADPGAFWRNRNQGGKCMSLEHTGNRAAQANVRPRRRVRSVIPDELGVAPTLTRARGGSQSVEDLPTGYCFGAGRRETVSGGPPPDGLGPAYP